MLPLHPHPTPSPYTLSLLPTLLLTQLLTLLLTLLLPTVPGNRLPTRRQRRWGNSLRRSKSLLRGSTRLTGSTRAIIELDEGLGLGGLALRTSGAALRTLPKPRIVVDNLDRLSIHQLLAELNRRRVVHRPVAHVDEDAAERRVVPLVRDDVDAVNCSLAEQLLEGVLDVAPIDIVKSARNANARLSRERHVCKEGGGAG